MKRYHIMYIFCAVLNVTVSATERKKYRDDYKYHTLTDAFYKLHSQNFWSNERDFKEICEMEGAQLMTSVTDQEMDSVATMMREHSKTGRYLFLEKDKMMTYTGEIITYPWVRGNSFVCKVEANRVPYDPICEIYAEGYYYYPLVGSCYRIPPIAYTWNEAEAECRAEGAHLAVINSNTESLVLKNMIEMDEGVRRVYENKTYLIGFRTKVWSREFETIFNQSLEKAGFSEWSAGEPNNVDRIENCGSMFSYDGKLNDYRCDGHPVAFICEKAVVNDF